MIGALFAIYGPDLLFGSVFYNLIGPLAAPLGATFGVRAVVMVSGMMVGGSLIVASFGSTVAQLIMILAIGYGKSKKV